MLNEYNALITKGTCVLIHRLSNVNIVRSMWLFKHKFNMDGSVSQYKAGLVASGRSIIDYDLLLHVSYIAQLTSYIDANSVGFLVSRRSTSGNHVSLGDNLLSLSYKCQATLSHANAEADYHGVANVDAETS
ncbi:ribonuclease H-like domain-containing protein [Tanacetum coccineum]